MRERMSLRPRATIGVLCAVVLTACGGDDSAVQPFPGSGKAGAGGGSGAAGKGGATAGAAGTATAAGTGGGAGTIAGGSAGSGPSAGASGSGTVAGAGGNAGAAAGAGAGAGTGGNVAAGTGGTTSAGAGGQGPAGTGGTAGSGGAAACLAPKDQCGDACVDIQSDVNNCGVCNFLCGIGSTCSAGKCVLSCGTGRTACGEVCVDLQSSTRNCGGCNQPCAEGQVCNGGVCGASCQPGKSACAGECVDTKADTEHCGACGKACALGQACNGGVCELSCGAGTKKCGDACVDQQSDVANCGGCGVQCVGSETCQAGTCKLSCDLPSRICGGLCVDPSSNKANCGSCGNACVGLETCSAGECKIICETGESICGGQCVDRSKDLNNCGSCGNVCPAAQACIAGSCKVECAAGQSACGSTCFDLTSDKDHCGSCGTACTGTQVCADGLCKNTCAVGQTSCSGSCVDLATDPNNCAACGTKCATGASCGPTGCACPSGESICSGACVALPTDPKNCGACGTTCGADETCQAGVCTPTCESQLKGNPVKDRWGFFWDGLERTSATLASAESACGAIGGRLPTATEIHRASAARTSDIGQNTQTNYLWTNVPYSPVREITARLSDGATTDVAVSASQVYRCVCAPPPTPGYGGYDCIGASKAECAELKREGKTYLIDKVDRAALPAGSAEWECQFAGGSLPSMDVYVDLLSRASGIGNGNNAWHHSSDQARYEGDVIVAWGAEGAAWTPTTSTMSWSYLYTARTSRCMGPKDLVTTKSTAAPANAFVLPGSGNALDLADRGPSTFQGAIDTCAAIGGHLPRTQDVFDGIVAGLPGGSGSWLWTSDQTAYDGANFTTGILSWAGVSPRYQYVYTGALNAVTWAYKHNAQPYNFRCGFPAVDPTYNGPDAAQCYTLPCAKFQSGPAGSGAFWIDKLDRPAATWPAAVSACQQAGGRLASELDLAEAVRQGLSGGSGAYIWTSEMSGYSQAPYAYAHIVKWSGTNQSFDDTYSTYMTWAYPTTPTPYRCVFTNEYRLDRGLRRGGRPATSAVLEARAVRRDRLPKARERVEPEDVAESLQATLVDVSSGDEPGPRAVDLHVERRALDHRFADHVLEVLDEPRGRLAARRAHPPVADVEHEERLAPEAERWQHIPSRRVDHGGEQHESDGEGVRIHVGA